MSRPAPGLPDRPDQPHDPAQLDDQSAEGQAIAYEASIPVGGIAMGGDCGVAKVDVSTDGGRTWYRTTLGPDDGQVQLPAVGWSQVPLRRGPTRSCRAAGIRRRRTADGADLEPGRVHARQYRNHHHHRGLRSE
jgi:hypothetical protein